MSASDRPSAAESPFPRGVHLVLGLDGPVLLALLGVLVAAPHPWGLGPGGLAGGLTGGLRLWSLLALALGAVSTAASLAVLGALDLAADPWPRARRLGRGVALFEALLGVALFGYGISLLGSFRERPFDILALLLLGLTYARGAARSMRTPLGPLSSRRRLGFVAVIAALWQGSPLAGTWLVGPIVLWTGAVWIALLVAGSRLAGIVAEATGEEVFGEG